MTGHKGPIVALAFSPDDRFLATGSMDSEVRLWDTAGGKLVHTFPGKGGIASSSPLSLDGRRDGRLAPRQSTGPGPAPRDYPDPRSACRLT